MAYNPGVQDRSGEILAQGIGQLGEGIQRGMMGYQQNKQMAALALGKFEGALQANPDLLQFLNPEQPSPNAPSEAVKAFMKLQKDGTVGLRDAAMLSTFADTYTKAKEDKQQAELRQQQMAQNQMLMAQQKQQQDAENQMNTKMQQYQRIGQDLQGPAGDLAAQSYDPETLNRVKQFMSSSAAPLVATGARLTPQQMVALQQGDAARLGATERSQMVTDRAVALQDMKASLGAQVQSAKAEAAAAKAEADALKSDKKDSATAFDETKKLRDEFSANPNTKSFDVVDNYYSRGVRLAKKETAAGDMGLIFALMKVYDPSSTVREGEYATASNSGSIPEQFLNIYNKAKDGQKLQPEQRAQFLDTMTAAAEEQHRKLMGTAAQYAAIAKKRGLDPEEVIAPSYMNWKPPVSAPTTAPAMTADDIANKWLKKK